MQLVKCFESQFVLLQLLKRLVEQIILNHEWQTLTEFKTPAVAHLSKIQINRLVGKLMLTTQFASM